MAGRKRQRENGVAPKGVKPGNAEVQGRGGVRQDSSGAAVPAATATAAAVDATASAAVDANAPAAAAVGAPCTRRVRRNGVSEAQPCTEARREGGAAEQAVFGRREGRIPARSGGREGGGVLELFATRVLTQFHDSSITMDELVWGPGGGSRAERGVRLSP